MKHAYLIIAHNEPELFGILVRLLDDACSDIYVMVDGKVDIAPFKACCTVQSRLIFVEPRIKNYWGMYTLVQSELALFTAAYQSGEEYAYYHLLSGVDLPLKTPKEIATYTAEANVQAGRTLEYVGFDNDPAHTKYIWGRVYRYHLFQEYARPQNAMVRALITYARAVAYKLQKLLGIKRTLPAIEIKKGHQWASLSHKAVEHILLQHAFIEQMFEKSECPDELYKQTVLCNSDFRDNFYNTIDENKGCLREIDWQRGHPYVWQKEDEMLLTESPAFFARKFSLQAPEGREIVERIARNVAQRKKNEGLA